MFVSILMLTGCGYMGYKKYPWSKTDKVMLAALALASVADVKSTMDAIDAGDGAVYETNIILGKYPSDSALVIHGAGVIAFVWYFGQYIHPDIRKLWIGVPTVTKSFAAHHNWKLYKKYSDVIPKP